MSAEDLEKYETEMELQLYREYKDIVRQFSYVVETERRFYLANSVDLQVRDAGGGSPASRTPSCSPPRPESGSTRRSSTAQRRGRWSSCRSPTSTRAACT